MYNVIIVDDELIIRRFYQSIIDWEEIGFRVVQLCQSGEEALDYIAGNKVDCVLTDVRMPGISGLELLSRCELLWPDIQVIIISGHSEFTYAKEALKHRATGFLIKPIDSEELTECMLKVKNELDKRNTDIFMLYQYKREFLNAVLHGHYRNEKNIEQILKNHKIDISKNTKTAVVKIFAEKESLQKALETYTTETFFTIIQNMIDISETKATGYFVSVTENSISYILFSQNEATDFSAVVGKHSDELIFALNNYPKISVKNKSIAYYKNFAELCCEDRKISLSIESNEGIAGFLCDNELFSEQKALLLSYIYQGDFSETKRQLSEFFEELKENDISSIRKIAQYLLAEITHDDFFNNICISNETIESRKEEIEKGQTLGKIFEATLSAIKYVMSYIGTDKKNNFAKNSVILAKNYIQEHFCENISLRKLASMYYLSPSYFSKTFKDVFGFTYAEFLKKCRLEKAKELLEKTDWKIHYISKSVGYENTKFFTRTFKQVYGISPKSYRENYFKEELQ